MEPFHTSPYYCLLMALPYATNERFFAPSSHSWVVLSLSCPCSHGGRAPSSGQKKKPPAAPHGRNRREHRCSPYTVSPRGSHYASIKKNLRFRAWACFTWGIGNWHPFPIGNNRPVECCQFPMAPVPNGGPYLSFTNVGSPGMSSTFTASMRTPFILSVQPYPGWW